MMECTLYSLTDPDSRWMKDKKGNYGLNYNYQVAIDSKTGMVVAQYLTTNPTDHNELLPMLYEIKSNLNQHPRVVLADTAYLQDISLKYAHEHGIQLVIPDSNESKKSKPKNMKKPFSKVNFNYDLLNDCFICPMGEKLNFKNIRKLNNVPMRVYSTNNCKSCPIHDQCTKSRVKEIFEPNKPLRLKLHQFYQSEKGQYYYKKRANLDEGYFGTMRKSRNFQKLERKGLKNGEKELTLRAIAHNIQKIHENLNTTLI